MKSRYGCWTAGIAVAVVALCCAPAALANCGGLQTPMRTPYEISDEDYAAKVSAVGSVDVLCCHIPPDLPDLLYDVGARRMERGSSAVLDAIRALPTRV